MGQHVNIHVNIKRGLCRNDDAILRGRKVYINFSADEAKKVISTRYLTFASHSRMCPELQTVKK
jgi:hypothetical protein